MCNGRSAKLHVHYTSSDWLKTDFGYKVQWQQIHRTVEQFTTSQTLGDILDSDWSKIVPLCDVSAATGPCIQKSTFNQSELV